MSRTWGSKCYAFTPGSHTTMGLYLLSKLNAPRLSTRKYMKLLMMILHSWVEGSYKSHSITMCSWVWTLALPHGQLVGRWEKNLCLYSPIKACLVIMRVNWAYSEFVKPMKENYDSPLAYIGLMTCCFSSSKFRKH